MPLPMRALPFTGTVCCKSRLPSWTECLASLNAQSLPGLASPTAFKPTCTWYHSHYGSQYASGLVGPLVIYGPNNTAYDEDLGPVMISDWYHEYYETVIDALLQPLPAVNIPMSDNNLINGKNSFNGNGAPMASFNFTSGKTYRLRLINPSAAAVQKFSIDGHTMAVIANDFVEIQPYETDHVTLAVGQRSDVLVKATGNATNAVWMRGYKPPPCWPTHGGDEAKAAIFYEDADRTQAPTTSAGPNAYDQYCGNDQLSQTIPTYAINPGEPSVTEIIPIEFRPNGTNLLWYLANRTFRADYNDPILLEAKQGNLDFPYIENVHNYGESCLPSSNDCTPNHADFADRHEPQYSLRPWEHRRPAAPSAPSRPQYFFASGRQLCW